MEKDANKTTDTNAGVKEDITASAGQGMSTLYRFMCSEQTVTLSEQKL